MNYKKYNDYELIDQIQENNEDSKNIMFEKYNPVLRSLAYEYYQKFGDYGYDYEDFLQEANISLYKALNSYNDQKNSLFYSFVVLCVRRGLLTFCRNISSSKKNISSRYLVDIDECSVEDQKNSLPDFFESQEFQNACRDVLFDLPFEIGIVFELKLNGFSYREIGLLLDIPSSSAEFRCKKAREKLRLQMRKLAL